MSTLGTLLAVIATAWVATIAIEGIAKCISDAQELDDKLEALVNHSKGEKQKIDELSSSYDNMAENIGETKENTDVYLQSLSQLIDSTKLMIEKSKEEQMFGKKSKEFREAEAEVIDTLVKKMEEKYKQGKLDDEQTKIYTDNLGKQIDVMENLGKDTSDLREKYEKLFKATGGIFAGGKWLPITAYANGGGPNAGELFMAREAGPEMVGTIGGHTAVMNNDQIVASVSDGVYRAVRMASGGNSNQGTQVYNIYLDEDHKIGTYTLEQLQNMAKTNGKPIRIGG